MSDTWCASPAVPAVPAVLALPALLLLRWLCCAVCFAWLRVLTPRRRAHNSTVHFTPFPTPSPSPPSPPSPSLLQVCIEDPFELTHDLGRTVDRQTRAVLHKEFTRAATLLRDADDPLDLLFSPYRVGARG